METVELTPYHEAPFGQALLSRGNLRLMLSAGSALTLAIMGSSILPIAAAFASTGVVCAVTLMGVVALANLYTCDLLLRQAYVAGKTNYEELAYAVGGEPWLIVTQLSIVVLLVGTLVGGMVQVGQAGAAALNFFAGASIPAWVSEDDKSRFVTSLATLLFVAPLCLVKQLRQLEYVGHACVPAVIWLMVAVTGDSLSAGLPALGNELRIMGFDSIHAMSGVVATFGFTFYIQPILMPMIAEMPRGDVGIKILAWSARFVTLGNAFLTYCVLGFFGAARYGAATKGNILQNEWIGGKGWQGLLNVFMCLYIAVSGPPSEFPVRHTLDLWFVRLLTRLGVENAKYRFKWRRHLAETSLVLGASLGIALAFPDDSAWVLLITGATGVCMVSYVIPVGNHLMMYYGLARCQRVLRAELKRNPSFHWWADVSVHSQFHGHVLLEKLQSTAVDLHDALPLLGPNAAHGAPNVLEYRKEPALSGPVGIAYEALTQVCLPLLVLVIGLVSSIAALTTAD
ncbi:Amino acid transporter protein [Klebsormidium nitens]|uniref:Amino acid transporter protein n=1 Tax=Klebsormidium nitens TaxID=105231 RepID=A0A1Y1HS92_KLENI|nr:Amino acid transporter protein [Klebsormidium nitens]|eukprot:GAQ81504.1 Amino acid transporter protein [Klebsormidium nitens]